MKDLENGIDDENVENNYPNMGSLVVNAILACLEDENSLVKRSMLDFLFSHLKLTREDGLGLLEK